MEISKEEDEDQIDLIDRDTANFLQWVVIAIISVCMFCYVCYFLCQKFCCPILTSDGDNGILTSTERQHTELPGLSRDHVTEDEFGQDFQEPDFLPPKYKQDDS